MATNLLKQTQPKNLLKQPVNLLKQEKVEGIPAEQKFSDMSTFMKGIDILGRPGYAVKSGIKEAMFDTEKSIPEAMIGGLQGKERVTANQLFKSQGVEGIPLLGFAGELAVDPLTYVGGPILKGVAKGVAATGKGLLKGAKAIPGVTKATGKIAQTIEPMTTSLKNMFVTRTGFKRLNDMISTRLAKRQYLKGKELDYGIKVRNVTQNIAAKYKKPIAEVEQQIINLIETPTVIPRGVPQESIALSNTIKTHLQNILTKELKAGVPITSLGKGSKGIEYFPRITSAEAFKYLNKARKANFGGNAKEWFPRVVNSMKRKTGDYTLQEFNDMVKAAGAKSLGGRSIEQFFLEKPAQALYLRGVRSAKAITSAEFLDDVGKIFGLRKAPQYWQEMPETITQVYPKLKGMKFDPEVMEEVTRTFTRYINPQEATGVLKGFDTMLNSWKRWTLAPFPKYHLRNMVGNFWNNHLADVNPKHYQTAQTLQMWRKFKGTSGRAERLALQQLDNLGFSPKAANDIIRKAEQSGVLDRGWYGADIESTIENVLKQEKGIIGRLMKGGKVIENNARLAHFVDKISIGDDVTTAANSVKKYLFDYGDLTQFEQQVMKRLAPFYTWTRKNVPLQLEQLTKKPQKFLPLGHPLRSRDPQDLLKLKYANPSMYERLPIEFKRTVDTVTYVPLEGLIPAADLTKMARPQEMLTELLNPYLRASIELGMNKSFYFENEIQRYPKETQELLKTDIPVKWKYLATTVLPQARLLNEMNKIVKKNVRKEKLTPGEQAFSQSLSSLYKMNLKDLKTRAKFRVKEKIDALKKGMFWAKKNERPKEEKRIRQTIKETLKLMKDIK